jgi:DNA-binding NarL/FixJ family response regulator
MIGAMRGFLRKDDILAECPSMSVSRILIADDHPMVRGAIGQAVAKSFGGAQIDEASDFNSLSALMARDEEVDVILLDLSMPGAEGFSGLMYLRAQYPHVPIIIVSARDEADIIRRSIEFGAAGYVPKTMDAGTIGEAIRHVLDGRVWVPADVDLKARSEGETADTVKKLATLTPQQVRVLMMLSQGLLNKQIAYELDVSEATVKAHVSAILTKLGVDSRTQAVIAAAKIAGTDAWSGGDKS